MDTFHVTSCFLHILRSIIRIMCIFFAILRVLFLKCLNDNNITWRGGREWYGQKIRILHREGGVPQKWLRNSWMTPYGPGEPPPPPHQNWTKLFIHNFILDFNSRPLRRVSAVHCHQLNSPGPPEYILDISRIARFTVLIF